MLVEGFFYTSWRGAGRKQMLSVARITLISRQRPLGGSGGGHCGRGALSASSSWSPVSAWSLVWSLAAAPWEPATQHCSCAVFSVSRGGQCLHHVGQQCLDLLL